jgi:FAD/FMN-containing dehydrogenase
MGIRAFRMRLKSMTTKPPTKTMLAELRGVLSCRLILPGEDDYDAARSVFYGWVDKRPAAIARASNVDDVVNVVNFARENGIELAVRSGGHSAAGHSVSEGGVVLDLADMRAIQIDVAGRTAWAEAGATAGQFTKAAGEHGLATGFGDTGSVGLGGITLGGGVGYLSRKFGLTVDSLLAAELVLADGRQVRVDAVSHPDLFWAIRGGGGNFGVATRFQFQLHLLPSIVGGLLILPATAETIAAFMAAAEGAPDELGTIANVMPSPPMPMVPDPLHGKPVIFAILVFAGDAERGEAVLAPFRKIREPLADMLGPKKYPEIFEGEEGPHPVAGVSRNMFVKHIDRAAGQTIMDFLDRSDAPLRVAQLRPLGGAIARVPTEATAYAHRQRKIMVNLACLYEDPKEANKHAIWVSEFAKALDQGEAGAYVNFVMDEGLNAAYPEATWKRLVNIKRQYDPRNLFHMNHNIPPGSGD